MKLIRLACAGTMVVVSGGCAERLTAPQQMAISPASAPAPQSLGRPLFVLDGHILNDQAEVNALDPNQIKDIQVLKGAAAVDRFGAAGVNGVVLITTKQAG